LQDVRDDVYGAMKSGMTGILVKTGKYMTGDEKKIFPHQPDYVCENFAKAVELLISEKKYFSKK
jgi:ribonucleotide monophosphatase NagD (HAD superfamily)